VPPPVHPQITRTIEHGKTATADTSTGPNEPAGSSKPAGVASSVLRLVNPAASGAAAPAAARVLDVS
jgi:hypothetical protein